MGRNWIGTWVVSRWCQSTGPNHHHRPKPLWGVRRTMPMMTHNSNPPIIPDNVCRSTPYLMQCSEEHGADAGAPPSQGLPEQEEGSAHYGGSTLRPRCRPMYW